MKFENKHISPAFSRLIEENVDSRIESALQILGALKTGDEENILQRIVRGTGSSMMNSKIGYYTLLAGTVCESVTTEQVLSNLETELKVPLKVTNKESADAFVGRVLVIVALIRRGHLKSSKLTSIRQIVDILVAACKQKAYHNKLAFSALVLLLNELSEKQFQGVIVPALRGDLKCALEKQNLFSLHFIIEAQRFFPNIITSEVLVQSLGSKTILNTKTFEHIYRIFWVEQNECIIMHSSYESLALHLANSSELLPFWQFVVQKLKADLNKKKEIISIKLITDIMKNLTKKETVLKLLNNDFIAIVFRTIRQSHPKDDLIPAVYLEFFDSLLATTVACDAETQVKIIEKLILNPGSITIEKFTLTNKFLSKALGQIDVTATTELSKIFNGIVDGTKTKGGKAEWLNFEKIAALKFIQKILTLKQIDSDFKLNQLEQLSSLFLSDEIVDELKTIIKSTFYRCLDSIHLQLQDEKEFLVKLVSFMNNSGKIKEVIGEHGPLWKKVMEISQRKAPNKSLLVCHVLLLHMALHLFNEPDVAAESISELFSCLERIKNKKPAKNESEPGWIEVLVDLFMHLLSLNSVVLRNLIKKLFQQVCGEMTLTAVHQMLSLLDMNDENPLRAENGEEESDEDESEAENDSNEDESESDDEDQSDQSGDEGEEEEATTSDLLKNAVTNVLFSKNIDSDQESMDVDDISEEEGNRLDAALAEAFKAWGGGGKKKSKDEKMEDTALIHFRNRVIDLLIVYLKSGPDLVVVFEVLTTLFKMLDFDKDNDELDTLYKKIVEGIAAGTAVKNFSEKALEIKESDVAVYLRNFIGQFKNPSTKELRNICFQKILKFVVSLDDKISKESKSDDSIRGIVKEEVDQFLTHRNPNLPYPVIAVVLQTSWSGNWDLVETLAKRGLDRELRAFRRIQAMELIRIVLKNKRLLDLNAAATKKGLLKLYAYLKNYLDSDELKLTTKEFKEVMTLLLEIKQYHKSNPELHCPLDCDEIVDRLQKQRSNLELDSPVAHIYNRFCSTFGVEKINQAPNERVNGSSNDNQVSEEKKQKKSKQTTSEADSDNNPQSDKKPGNTMKRKAYMKDKKLKKQKRAKISSEGLDTQLSFTTINGTM